MSSERSAGVYTLHMKKKKLIPFAFIALLIIVVIFIVGLQYGRKVAETDKAIHYLLSITPTRAITPSPVISITYNTLTGAASENCGVSFLYPSTMKVVQNSTQSSTLRNSTGETIAFSCNKTASLFNQFDTKKTATASVTFQDDELSASKSGSLILFTAKNTKNRQTVQFVVSDSLLPLLEKTLTLTK